MHPTVGGLPRRLVLWWLIPVNQLTNPVTAKCSQPLCPNSALPSWGRRLAPSRKVLPSLHRSYGLMRQTFTLLPISGYALIRKVFAGCCQPLLRKGPSQRYLCRPSLCAGTPAPAAPKVLFSARRRPIGAGRGHSKLDFSAGSVPARNRIRAGAPSRPGIAQVLCPSRFPQARARGRSRLPQDFSEPAGRCLAGTLTWALRSRRRAGRGVFCHRHAVAASCRCSGYGTP
jgi:hypothetical protein